MSRPRLLIAHLVFSVNASSGGIGPSVQGLTSALSDSDCVDTTTFVPRSGFDADFPTLLKQFETMGPPQHCFSRTLARELFENQTNLVHCHGLWTFLSRSNLKWAKAGKPYLVSPHGMTMPAAMSYSRWKKKAFWVFFEGSNLHTASCLHALSRFEAESIRQLGIKNTIIQIGNGVDLPERTANQDRNVAGSDSARTMLYLGRIHPIKGLDRLIGAWKDLKSNSARDDWRLQVVGWGEDDHVTALREHIANDSSIEFSGPLFGEAKHEAMRKANAFVLPSSSEAFPMALLEAWSHGLPSIATKTCNVLDKRGNQVGFFVDPSTEGIRDGLVTMMESSDQQRKSLGTNARAIVEAEYSWSAIASKFISVYRWLLGSGPEPTGLLVE